MSFAARRVEVEAASRPWRVLVAAPPHGWDGQLAMMHAWLDHHCGHAGWEMTPAGIGGVVNDALAFYFADATSARAFIARFCCGYRAG